MILIYRATEKNNPNHYGRPPWFNKKRCFKSLMDAVDFKVVEKVYVIFDGLHGDLYDYMTQFPIDLVSINSGSNKNSLLYCYEFSKNLNFDTIYFVEDDYLHLPNSIKILDEGIQAFGLVTLYDHLDRYTVEDDINKDNEMIRLTKSSHWRSVESTTCTWACARNIYTKIIEHAISYALDDRAFFRHLIELKIRLFGVLPGKATHVNSLCSPLVDWKAFNSLVCL